MIHKHHILVAKKDFLIYIQLCYAEGSIKVLGTLPDHIIHFVKAVGELLE